MNTGMATPPHPQGMGGWAPLADCGGEDIAVAASQTGHWPMRETEGEGAEQAQNSKRRQKVQHLIWESWPLATDTQTNTPLVPVLIATWVQQFKYDRHVQVKCSDLA